MDIFLFISLALISYVLILILLKNLNFWKKKRIKIIIIVSMKLKPLERIRRNKLDYLINYITFQLYDFKRYRCTSALECRRWDKPFKGKF